LKYPQEKISSVARVVLLDRLCRVLIQLIRRHADVALDEDQFVAAAKDIIREAIAAEDVAIKEEAMVVEAVLEDLHFAFKEANRHLFDLRTR
jgi:hypothetical protein